MPRRFRPITKLLYAIQAAAAALLIAACGGSSSTHLATALPAQRDPNKHGLHATAKAHRDVVTSGEIAYRPLPGTGIGEVNDDNPGYADAPGQPQTDVRRAAGQIDPCTLVSKAEAETILGRPIKTPVEAPLGPTCIYQPVGAKGFITLTVESIDFAAVRALIRNRTQFDVGGRAGYCGFYGQPTAFVPVASGQVLTVIAPCPTGIQFAAKAAVRVKSK